MAYVYCLNSTVFNITSKISYAGRAHYEYCRVPFTEDDVVKLKVLPFQLSCLKIFDPFFIYSLIISNRANTRLPLLMDGFRSIKSLPVGDQFVSMNVMLADGT